MQIAFDNPHVKQNAERLAAELGTSVEDAVLIALDESLSRRKRAVRRPIHWDAIRAIQQRIAALPVLDDRSEDEILGYNEHGHFDCW